MTKSVFDEVDFLGVFHSHGFTLLPSPNSSIEEHPQRVSDILPNVNYTLIRPLNLPYMGFSTSAKVIALKMVKILYNGQIHFFQHPSDLDSFFTLIKIMDC